MTHPSDHPPASSGKALTGKAPMPASEAQHQALAKLRAHGGEGVIDKHGKIVAGGVRLMGFDPITWLRLITTGHVEARGPLRIGLTDLGMKESTTAPKKVHQDLIHKPDGYVPPRPGAE